MLTNNQKLILGLINLITYAIIVIFALMWIWGFYDYHWEIISTSIILNLVIGGIFEIIKSVNLGRNETLKNGTEKSKFQERLENVMNDKNRRN